MCVGEGGAETFQWDHLGNFIGGGSGYLLEIVAPFKNVRDGGRRRISGTSF